MKTALSESDALAALVDRAAQAARGVVGIDAFEIRADAHMDWRTRLQGQRPQGTQVTETSGLGIRVFVGRQSAYVHAPNATPARVRELVASGARLARAQDGRGWAPTAIAGAPVSFRKLRHAPAAFWPTEVDAEGDVLDVLRRVTQTESDVAPAAEPHASLGARVTRVVTTDSLGSWIDLSTLVSTLYTSVALREPRFGNGAARRGGQIGLAGYTAGDVPESLGRLAAERAIEATRAVALPSGRYRVLCDNELSGTLAHESFGHLTEYDLVASGWSSLRGRLGERLAVEGVSVTDAGVVDGGRQGIALPYDDQGLPTEPVTMLEDGVLRKWLHTRESAHDAGQVATGNGRALSSRFAPIVRMRNTYFEPGDRSIEEALEQLGDGVYLCGARGGAPQSDGSFMFISIRGYLVEKGKPTVPLRTAAIHGNVLDFLQNVECVTRDFEVSTNYFGGCGKGDQSFLHVGIGGPHILVKDALLGGS